MADCSYLFYNLNKTITLTHTDRKYLRNARKAITQKLKSYFNENEQCPKVEFRGQGSFSMGTIVRPIRGEYDIDIGVYLIGLGNWQSGWPKPETASQWLVKALQNHTSSPPANKRNCVRITYKATSANPNVGYHVDLPIYCEYKDLLNDKYTRIGINGEKQWSRKSDPVGFTLWFFKKCQENPNDKDQLVRLVKYMKVWKDFVRGEVKFPSGMALTILMAEEFVPHERDDLAFHRTVVKVYNRLFAGFWSLFLNVDEVNSPVEPFNDVIERLTKNQNQIFKEALGKLCDDGKEAISETDQYNAEAIWRSNFDRRM